MINVSMSFIFYCTLLYNRVLLFSVSLIKHLLCLWLPVIDNHKTHAILRLVLIENVAAKVVTTTTLQHNFSVDKYLPRYLFTYTKLLHKILTKNECSIAPLQIESHVVIRNIEILKKFGRHVGIFLSVLNLYT